MAAERAEVTMYSDYKSPFAFLAFEPAFALEQRYAVRVRWIPFQLRIKGKGERSQASEWKAKYSYLDVRRFAARRGIRIRGPQKVYDTTPALIGGLFAERAGKLREYSRLAYERFFLREFEADRADAVAALLTEVGLDPGAFRTFLEGEGRAALTEAEREAAEDHAFGVPLFLFAGEPFWGHDRLPLLEERLREAGLAL